MTRFKIADRAEELEQIQRLAYCAFVEEIPQHPPNPQRRHVDRFHDENTYVIGIHGGEVIAMVAIRKQRPFSLDGKLENLDQYLPSGRRFCELRLLTVAKEHRGGAVLHGLLRTLWTHLEPEGFDAAVISATTRQLPLYGHLGFLAFGPIVGTAAAPFQPMLITRERFVEAMRAGFTRTASTTAASQP